ncbi:MAG TPA: peptidoglycan-binding domain-containing protein [Thermohalobaculum sp.]|nr:peptidoglycan-binding domain-containing protein [Thermohalobaculum sp.]
MRGGLVPVTVLSLGVGAVLVWTMAAHDPYWRLFETQSVPAPAYESPGEIRAGLAAAVLATSHPDSAASRPETPAAGSLAELGLALLPPRPAEPLIAVPAALTDQAAPTVAPPLAPAPAFAGPAKLRPVSPRDAAGATVRLAALDPVPPAAPPAPLWLPADSASEAALALARAERADVQRRLALAGFDPRGFDGVFGPRTRQAIADFQEAWGFAATGYLDSAAYADLQARTEEAYAALASRAAAEPRAAPSLAPLAPERRLAANDSGGCARDAHGRIVERQSFGCDLKGFAESVVSLGRNKLPHEEGSAEDGAVAMAAGSAFATAGSDR